MNEFKIYFNKFLTGPADSLYVDYEGKSEIMND